MRKITCAMLLAALLLQMAACGGTASSGDTTTAAPASDTTAEETTGYLPEDLRFNGETVTWYVRSGTMNEYFVEEQTGEIVDDAVYTRNLNVMERLNVDFEFHGEVSDWSTRTKFAETLQASIMAGDAEYDIVSGYSMGVANMAAYGLLYNLLDTEYLNFDQPWWMDNLTKQALINDKLYFATGDISTNSIMYLFGMYFNKDILEAYKLENPYELVKNNKWTLDKAFDMSKNVYKDLNGDSKKDVNDQFGFTVPAVCIDALYFSSGLHTTEIGDDGMPFISKDMSSEKVVDLVEYLCTNFFDNNDNLAQLESDSVNPFFEGHALFTIQGLFSASTTLRDAKYNWGLLPIPKYDENQEDFVTIANFGYGLYGIPTNAKNPDLSAAVLEACAAEGYKHVSPALYETAMKVKYSPDDDAALMFDIIKGSMCFEFGRVFTDNLSSLTFNIFRNCVKNNDPTWMSTFESKKSQLDELFKGVLENFE